MAWGEGEIAVKPRVGGFFCEELKGLRFHPPCKLTSEPTTVLEYVDPGSERKDTALLITISRCAPQGVWRPERRPGQREPDASTPHRHHLCPKNDIPPTPHLPAPLTS